LRPVTIYVICPLGLVTSQILKSTIEVVMHEMGVTGVKVTVVNMEEYRLHPTEVCFASQVFRSMIKHTDVLFVRDALDKNEIRRHLEPLLTS